MSIESSPNPASANEPAIRRALISVSDKSGLPAVAKELAGFGIEFISTGGTSTALKEAGLTVKDVAEVTNFPEMMDGRVKTLHPKIHGGLLAVRDNQAHQQAQQDHDIANIDLLIVNLYPFEQTVASNASYDVTIENIDIGGPALIRAAAKNHDRVTVIVDPDDYDELLQELRENNGTTTLAFRRRQAAKAYARTAAYDAAISGWFANELDEQAPRHRTFAGRLDQELRYGENPHQWSCLYVNNDDRIGVATAKQIQGKDLSYNNLNDTDAAFELVCEFDPSDKPAIAIIKHANPCGVALGSTLLEAYQKALSCDPVSAFGGIIAANTVLDRDTASEISNIFTEVIIAPDADDEAKKILAEKKNLRLLLTGGLPDPRQAGIVTKMLSGGFLLQSRDNAYMDDQELKVVTKRQPTENELNDMKFAFKVAKHVKSNAIVYVKDGATVGVGAGQMSRVDSARIAAWKAQEAATKAGLQEPLTKGSAVASDAFFPFADGLLETAKAGATCIIQPGGSMNDDEVIAAADDHNLAMVFTGVRHFRH